jgi:predicted CXXCH cytochrome family protein
MRKLGLLVIVIAALALVPAVASAAITGSAHDLSSGGASTYKGTSDQICIYCHTPHNANTPQLAPLWNHPSTAVASFTFYSSSSFNGSTTIGQPSNNSKACLSCHDGTLAADSYGATTGTHTITGTALLGTNLSDDHPISFTYNAALATADGGLVSPASASEVVAGIPLYAEKLECASCHNVHDNANDPFLRFANAASALCLKCHVK